MGNDDDFRRLVCKPHSASYARVSFQAAWLKVHFPAEFMAAVLSNRGGFYGTLAYVSEARRMGLQIDPPDVNRSDISWTGCKQRMRVGLSAIGSLSCAIQEKIVTCRHSHEPFDCSVNLPHWDFYAMRIHCACIAGF